MKKIKKLKLRTVLTVVLGLGLLVGAIALVSNLIKPKEDDGFKEIHPTFEYGGIDNNGKFIDTKESLVTKELIEFDEMKCNLDFDSNVTYQLFFYDENEEKKSFDYVEDKNYEDGPLFLANEIGARYVRIVITPVLDIEDEDKEIKWYDVVKYTSQLKIEKKINEVIEDENVLLTFTLLDPSGYTHVYNFEKGMTWAEFIESEYNFYETDVNLVFTTSDSVTLCWDDCDVFIHNDTNTESYDVVVTDLIIADMTYHLN